MQLITNNLSQTASTFLSNFISGISEQNQRIALIAVGVIATLTAIFFAARHFCPEKLGSKKVEKKDDAKTEKKDDANVRIRQLNIFSLR